MLDWLADHILNLLHYFPAVFTEPGSANFFLSRAMIGLLLVMLLICFLPLLPFRRIADGIRKILSRLHITKI